MAQTSVVRGVQTHIGTADGFQYVQYHATKVIQWNENTIKLNHGGWRTRTTAVRIHQARNQFNLEFFTFQKNYGWFLDYNGHVYPWRNTEIIINRKAKTVLDENGVEISPIK